MKENERKYRSGCPVAYTLEALGDRWSLLLVRDLALKGVKTYGELLDGWEGISTNILAQRLKHLEDHGIVSKSRDPENWRSYIYELTDKGRDLAPVLAELILWGGKYDRSDDRITETVEKVTRDRERFEREIRAGDVKKPLSSPSADE